MNKEEFTKNIKEYYVKNGYSFDQTEDAKAYLAFKKQDDVIYVKIYSANKDFYKKKKMKLPDSLTVKNLIEDANRIDNNSKVHIHVLHWDIVDKKFSGTCFYNERVTLNPMYEKKSSDNTQSNQLSTNNQNTINTKDIGFSNKKQISVFDISKLAKKFRVSTKAIYLYLEDAKILIRKGNSLELSADAIRGGFDISSNSKSLLVPEKHEYFLDEHKWTLWILNQKDAKKNKGDNFEIECGREYEKKGYIVKFNGLENGKEDNSVDVIAFKPNNEILLIQCKHWSFEYCKKNGFLSSKNIKAFNSDADAFLEKNTAWKDLNLPIKKLFISKNDVFNDSAKEEATKIDNFELIVTN